MIRKTNKSNVLQITRDAHFVLNSVRDMSKESTVSTALGLIDVANVRQDFHTLNN